MRALRLHAPGELQLHEEPDPVAADGEELVRVSAVGLCGSDRHWFVEGAIGDAVLGRPLVLGHEIAGIIADGPRQGLRVVVDPADPCGHCDLCLAGRGNLCLNLRFLGHGTTDGGLRTLLTWPRQLLSAVPDAMSDAEATLLEPLGIAVHALSLAEVRRGMSAGVYGCGPLGLLILQALRRAGCEPIIATDVLPHRLSAARALGAAEVFAGSDESTAMPAVDVAFEVAGEDTAVDDAVRSVRPGGRVVLVGIPSTDHTSFRASVARRKGLSLILCRRMRAADLARAVQLASTGTFELAGLISERDPLASGREAFASLVARTGVKIVIEPQAGA
jgi:L-iditol 2-dehydrogenase